MVNLYRISHSPNETLINFQGTPDSVKDLEKILGFRPRASKLSRYYEGGYFAYLRGPRRKEREREALKYLRENYQPPSVELLWFRGNIKKVPTHVDLPDYANFLRQEIHKVFANTGNYICSSGGLAYEIFPKKPVAIGPNLKGFVGVTYTIFFVSDRVPVIQVDISYLFHLNGKPVNWTKLRSFADKGIEKKLKTFTTRNTNDIFQLGKDFIKSICFYREKLDVSFSEQPLPANEIDFFTWLWAHDNPIEFKVENDVTVPLAKEITERRSGLYKLPQERVALIVLIPSKDTKKICLFDKWSDLNRVVEETVDSFAPNTPVSVLEYSHLISIPDQINSVEQFLQDETKGFSPLFLMIAPPRTNLNDSSKLKEVQSFTASLHKRLRRIKSGAYILTVNWNKICDDIARKYIIENSILKGFTVMGAIPWLVQNIPLANQTTETCFIGIDINIRKSVPVVGGVIFDSKGVLKGYQLVRIQNPDGDKLRHHEFEKLLKGLLGLYEKATGNFPEHLIVHRDGIVSTEELEVGFLSERNITIDFVEIRKSGGVRIRQRRNIDGTPSKDIAIGNGEIGVAYLVNTLTFQERSNNGKKVFPCPTTISVRKILGDTSLKLLSAQIYALSYANYSSFRRT